MGKFGLIGKDWVQLFGADHQMFGNYTYELLETGENELEDRIGIMTMTDSILRAI